MRGLDAAWSAVDVGAGLGLGMAWSLGALLVSACAGGGFTCEGDEQCTLAGEPGVCLDSGRCAYPDPDCASGLAHPLGASEHAGECVPGEAASAGSSTTDAPGSTGDAPGTSTDALPVDTGDADSSSSSGDPIVCDDPYEPNDDEKEAAPIPFGAEQGCLATWDAFLDDPLDADWFVLDTSDGACRTTEELTVVTNPPLELCVVPACPDDQVALILACDGTSVELTAGPACCGSQQLRVTMICESDQEPLVQLGVAASSDLPMCLPYEAGALL